MSIPFFPVLIPRILDPLWFCLDQLGNEDAELQQLESEHQSWLRKIAYKDSDVIPIGKTVSEREEDEEEEEDEEDTNDDEESETQEEDEEEMEVDSSYDRVDSAPVIDP